jgi:hypothetical protein
VASGGDGTKKMGAAVVDVVVLGTVVDVVVTDAVVVVEVLGALLVLGRPAREMLKPDDEVEVAL